MKHVAIVSFLFALSLAVQAAFPLSTHAVAPNTRGVASDLHELGDPAEFADDICWVAPEWRED